MIHDLSCPIPNVCHLLHPEHLILRLELFRNALTGGHLFYQLKEHTLCPLVQIGKITIQLAGGQQLRIERLSVLPEKPLVPLSPNADGLFILNRYCQAGNVIIAPQLVPQTVAFIKKILAEL